jgi:phage terminase large subunit
MAGNFVKLTKPQTEFFLTKHKYTLMCAGFGAGKSEALFFIMIMVKLSNPKVDVAYFAPSYQLIRDIAFGRILNILDDMGLNYNLNKAESNLYINGYGTIMFRTMDAPDRIVGYEVFACFIDELDTMRMDRATNAWNKIIARNRQRNPDDPKAENKIYVASTPEGFNFCYNRWGKDNSDNNPNSPYRLIKAPTTSNPYLPEDYVDSLKATYPANLINAYINGEFVNLNSKTVYTNFDRHRNHLPGVIEPNDTLYVGMDFNILNMNATIHKKIDHPHDPNRTKKIPHAVSELTKIADTPAMAEALRFKFPDNPIVVYPDASGKGRKTVDVSTSDLTILRDHGFTIRAKNRNPFIKNRIQSMNAAFLNGKDETNYFVDIDNCPQYTNALEQQSFNDNGVPEKDPANNIDDLNDSAGYFIEYDYPVTRQRFTTTVVNL